MERFIVVETPDGSISVGINESIEAPPPLTEPVPETPIESPPDTFEVIKYNKNVKLIFHILLLISIYNLVTFCRIFDIQNVIFVTSSTIAVQSIKPISIAMLVGHVMYSLTTAPVYLVTHKWFDFVYIMICLITCVISLTTLQNSLCYRLPI
jgi:hypothetical protein